MDSDEIARILDRANDFLDQAKPEDALRCLAQIEPSLTEPDDRIEAASIRAWALSELGRHDDALEALRAPLEEFMDSSRLHAALGVVLSNADQLEGARQALEHAFELNDQDDVVLANLALVYEKLRDYEHALQLYDRALLLGADIDWALQRKAAAQTELGDYGGAKKTLRRYLSIAPEDSSQWLALGILHSEDDEFDEAIDCYERAEKDAPDSAWLHLNWGVTAVRAGKMDLAEKQLDELRRCAPGTARPWLLKAYMMEEVDDIEAAEDAYRQAIDALDASDADVVSYTLEMAIDFYAQLRRFERCQDLLKRAYHANACTVELCESYREALGRRVAEGTWFSVEIEADYRDGLDEVREPGEDPQTRPERFRRNYQVIARDRDEATAIVLDFLREMGENNARVCEFVNDERVDDTFTGVYEVERRCLVFTE